MEENGHETMTKGNERDHKGAIASDAAARVETVDSTMSRTASKTARDRDTGAIMRSEKGRFKQAIRPAGALLFIFFMLAVPVLVYGQSSPPPVGAPLVREGNFAVSLAQGLGIGNATDEVEAESLLGGVGIAPRNGWIADYPVTPDIVGELQKAVREAADARRIPLGKDEALQRFADVNVQTGMTVTPYTGNETGQAASSTDYPNPAALNDYYTSEGPPIVTYYTPPPDFYYLYAWVPFPFFCADFWFPGFFVLHDFHRIVLIRNHPFFVSNHFNDIDRHRVFRIDPERRFVGRTFAGIAAPRSRGFISSGVPKADRRVFNAPHAQMVPGGGMNRSGFGRWGGNEGRFGGQGFSHQGMNGGFSHGGHSRG